MKVNSRSCLTISGAGAGDVSVVIVDPQNKNNTVEVLLENKGDKHSSVAPTNLCKKGHTPSM